MNGALERGWLYSSALRPVAELDGAGAVVSRFVYGTGGNVPDYLERGGWSYRLVTDHVGSVRLVVDAATGEVAQRLDYDVWGRVLKHSDPGSGPSDTWRPVREHVEAGGGQKVASTPIVGSTGNMLMPERVAGTSP